MEIFYSDNISSDTLVLSAEDSVHCVRVLRHKVGDCIQVVDGKGTMYDCRIISTGAESGSRCAREASVEASISQRHYGWNSHPYDLTMAVCPTKNTDRYEWFVEKATEMGVDTICPIIGERSERRVYKTDRARKIVLSAMKQSLKSSAPSVCEPLSVRDFICSGHNGLKFIAYCFEDDDCPRVLLQDALQSSMPEHLSEDAGECSTGGHQEQVCDRVRPQVTILIGPEGDFSRQEAALALQHGYIPIHLGSSRLRTETAALVAVAQVYSLFCSHI